MSAGGPESLGARVGRVFVEYWEVQLKAVYTCNGPVPRGIKPLGCFQSEKEALAFADECRTRGMEGRQEHLDGFTDYEVQVEPKRLVFGPLI